MAQEAVSSTACTPPFSQRSRPLKKRCWTIPCLFSRTPSRPSSGCATILPRRSGRARYISVKTVRNWEQGRRDPSGPGRRGWYRLLRSTRGAHRSGV